MRTCGNDKEGKGYGTGHVGNENFCREAPAPTFSAQSESTQKVEAGLDDILLQVIKIPWADGKRGYESVL